MGREFGRGLVVFFEVLWFMFYYRFWRGIYFLFVFSFIGRFILGCNKVEIGFWDFCFDF